QTDALTLVAHPHSDAHHTPHSDSPHHSPPPHRDLHSFPTRRSSDLATSCPPTTIPSPISAPTRPLARPTTRSPARASCWAFPTTDRKSTRLNSSHRTISYAVFCLKKKKQQKNTTPQNHDDRYTHAAT